MDDFLWVESIAKAMADHGIFHRISYILRMVEISLLCRLLPTRCIRHCLDPLT